MSASLRKKIVLVLLGVFPSFLAAQSTIDSLRSELSKYDEAQVQYVKLYTILAKEYADSNPDTALVMVKRAFDLAQTHQMDSLLGQIFITYSTTHSYLANYQSSMEFAFRAIEEAEKYRDTVNLIDAFNNIGIDFMFQEEDEKAIEYFTKVELLSKLSRDSLRWGHALNNLGMMAGYSASSRDELNYYDQAAVIFKDIGEREGYANTLLNSGTVYTVLEQFKEADILYRRALKVFQEIEMASGIQNTLQSMSENLMRMGQLDKANAMALDALTIAQESEFAQDEIYTYDLLSQIAKKRDDFSAALDYLKKKNEVEKEVFTAEKSQQIAELDTKYQTEKKEHELAIASLRVEQQQLEKYVLGGVLILVIGVAVFIIYSIRQKSSLEQKLLSEEIENLRLKIGSLLGDSGSMKIEKEDLNKNLHQPLSDREFEILNLTVSDKTNQEIANEVFVSVNTVKFHLKNVYEKLGVNNRKEALHLIVGQS